MAAAWFARSLRAPLLHARPAAASTPGIHHQIGYGGHLLRPMSMLSELAALDHTELRRRVRHELRACTRPGPRRAEKVLNVLDDMHTLGVPPQDADYRTVIPLLVYENQLEELDAVYLDMKASGVIPDLITIRSLLEAYSRAGHTGRVLELITLVRALGLQGSDMEELMTFSKVLFGQWMVSHFEQSFALMTSLRNQGAPIADIMHTALVELHGRHMRHIRQRSEVLMKLAKHLVPSDDSTDAELLVLYDYSCEQAELLDSERVAGLLDSARVEAGAACLARCLASPGTWRAADLHAMYQQVCGLLGLLGGSDLALADSTLEDVMWAAHALHQPTHALYMALGLAQRGVRVSQWQQLPHLALSAACLDGVQAAAAPMENAPAAAPTQALQGASGSALAVELCRALCPAMRQSLVLEQVQQQLATQAATDDTTDAFLDTDSDEDSDQDLEDMQFTSDDEEGLAPSRH